MISKKTGDSYANAKKGLENIDLVKDREFSSFVFTHPRGSTPSGDPVKQPKGPGSEKPGGYSVGAQKRVTNTPSHLKGWYIHAYVLINPYEVNGLASNSQTQLS